MAGKTAPKVTREAIEAKIRDVRYHFDGVLTICVVEMRNGFLQLGSSAPASAANFDAEVGKRYAFEDAFRGLWRLEGYLLRERLHEEEAEG